MTTPFALLQDVNTRRRTALAALLGVLAATLSTPALAAEIGDPGLGYDRVLGFNFGVGDFNGDGDDDLAMGVPTETVSGLNGAGAVHVLYGDHLGEGPAFGWPYPWYQLWTQDSPNIRSAADVHEGFGGALTVGDFDGDGFDDLVVGVYGEEVGGAVNAGGVNVIYGGAAGLSDAGNQRWTQNSSGIAESSEENEFFGAAMAAGDFNDDGYDDLAVGAPYEERDDMEHAGVVHVIYGSEDGLDNDVIDDQLWHQDVFGIAGGVEANDRFGSQLGTGDFDNDGCDDLVIAAEGESIGTLEYAGAVHIIYGSRSDGLVAAGDQLWHQDTSGIGDVSEVRDYFGSYLATGDFNRDTFDDLAISVRNESIGDVSDAGAVHVIYGTAEGLSAEGTQFWHQDVKGVPGKPDGGEHFGQALAVGDFDSNGYDDLAVSVPYEDLKGVRDAGMVQVLFGFGNGLSTKGTAIVREGVGRIESDYGGLWGIAGTDERLGFALAAGDFNENGNLDGFKNSLVIGVPRSIQNLMTDPGTRTGLVHVLWPDLNAYNHWNSFFTLRP